MLLSLAREKLPSTPPPLLQTPLRHSTKRAFPTEKPHKMCNPDHSLGLPPPFPLTEVLAGERSEKKESGMLVLTSDKVPQQQGKQKKYHPQSAQKNQRQQVVTPEISPPLSRTPASLLCFPLCFALIQAAVAAED